MPRFAYSVSDTKTAVVSAGTVTVPCCELKVDCRVAGSLECCWTGCRCSFRRCSRPSVKLTCVLLALKATTMCCRCRVAAVGVELHHDEAGRLALSGVEESEVLLDLIEGGHTEEF